MKDLEEMLRELSEKYKNSKSVEVYEEDLEWWFKIIDDLREENKKLKEKQKVLDKENCELIDKNVKLKKRIYQNVHWWPRIDYQEFCKKNWI